MAIRGGMPDMMLAVSKGFVDGGMISAPSNLRGMKLGPARADRLRRAQACPISTRRSAPGGPYIKTNRDIVLRVLRAYYQGVQETHNDRDGATKILAKYTRVAEPEILAESYRIYGQKHLQKTITRRFRRRPAIAESISAKKPPAPTRASLSTHHWCRSWKKKASFRRKTNNGLPALARKSCKPKKRRY